LKATVRPLARVTPQAGASNATKATAGETRCGSVGRDKPLKGEPWTWQRDETSPQGRRSFWGRKAEGWSSWWKPQGGSWRGGARRRGRAKRRGRTTARGLGTSGIFCGLPPADVAMRDETPREALMPLVRPQGRPGVHGQVVGRRTLEEARSSRKDEAVGASPQRTVAGEIPQGPTETSRPWRERGTR